MAISEKRTNTLLLIAYVGIVVGYGALLYAKIKAKKLEEKK